MADRVRALVLEQPGTGGQQLDYTPTEVDPREDGLDARAFFAQNGTSADSTAYLSRATGAADLTLTDAVAGTKRAQDLVSQVLGAQAAHQALVHLAHFLEDGGPSDGWASGAVCRLTYQGILPLTKTWYASAAASAPKIISCTWTYPSGSPLPSSKAWALYSASGALVRQMTDSYVRQGPLAVQVTRTWS